MKIRFLLTLAGLAMSFAVPAAMAQDAMKVVTADELERDGFLANAVEQGAYLLRRLSDEFSRSPIVGQVRGLGLMAGLDLVADRGKRRRFSPHKEVAHRIVSQGYEEGVIVRALPDSDCIALSPPLCITASEVDRLVEGVALAVTKVTDQLTREGARLAS